MDSDMPLSVIFERKNICNEISTRKLFDLNEPFKIKKCKKSNDEELLLHLINTVKKCQERENEDTDKLVGGIGKMVQYIDGNINSILETYNKVLHKLSKIDS